MDTLIRTSARLLRRRPWQSGLLLLGIALGVSVVIAIDIANESSRRAFHLSTEALIGKATHQIRGGPAGLSEELYRQIRVEQGIKASAPIVEAVGIAYDFDREPLQILGVDPIAESPFRNYLEQAPYRLPGFERFYTDPSSAIISKTLSQRYGLRPGDPLRIQINDSLNTLSVLAVMSPQEGQLGAALDNLLLMDIAAAQELTGMTGKLSRIDLILPEAATAQLADQLPPNVQLKPASDQAATVSQLTSAFELNLTALSLLALVVGMFMIYNTMMFSVVQRRTSLGTFRVLGVTGRRIFLMVLFESVMIGAIGSLIGIALGYGMGRGAIELVSQTINDLYFAVTVREIVFTPAMLIKGLIVGIGASALAALLPASEAARVPPVTVLQRSKVELGFQRLIPRITAMGLVTIAVSVGSLWFISDSLLANFAGLFLLILGIALIVPLMVLGLIRIVTPVLERLGGLNGRLAARRVVGSLSRTGVAIAALMIALAVTIGVSIMISSFRSTVENWLDITLQADLYVAPPTSSGTQPSAFIAPELASQVLELENVDAVESFHGVVVDSPLGSLQLSVVDGQRVRGEGVYRFASGTPDQVWAALQDGSVIVSEPFAYRYELPSTGGEVDLFTDHGLRTFPVVAIYYDYSSDRGAVLMTDATYRKFWDDPFISSFAVYLSEGVDLDQVSAEIRRMLGDTGLGVQANRVLRDQALQIFDRTFAITTALRLLTVVVAFIGVLSSLLAMMLDRTRERATMIALGMRPRDVLRTALFESGLIGATAGLISWPTGVIMALVLIYVINLRSFGWTIQMKAESWIFSQAFIVGVVASLLASIYPIVKQMRAPVVDGLRQE